MSLLTLLVRVLLVAVIAAAVGVAALVFSRAQPTEYQAEGMMSFSSSVRPELQVLGAGFVRPTTDPKTFTASNAQLVASYRVAREVASNRPELGLTSDQVAGRVSVAPVSGTEMIRVSATGETPAEARELVDTYVAEFRRWYRERESIRARAVRRALTERYEGFTESQRESETGASVRNQLTTLSLLENVGSGSPDLIEAAHGSSAPEQPKTRRNVLFGLIFGLAVGIGLVALRAEFARRLPASPDQTPQRATS